MEYGQIFHVTRIGKYYCKNMKYRINIYIPYSGYFSGGVKFSWMLGFVVIRGKTFMVG